MEMLINLIIEYTPKLAAILGTVYAGLIASRGLLTFIVGITKTDKDNAIVKKVFDFLDKYGVDFKKLEK